MTYAELLTEFYSITGDTEASPLYFSNASVTLWMKKAVRLLNSREKIVRAREIKSLTSDTGEYDLPSDCHEVFRVTYDGEKIEPLTQARLDSFSDEWRDDTGKPTHYYLDRLNGKIGLYPIPDIDTQFTSVGTDDGFYAPTEASGGEDGIYIDPAVFDGTGREDGVPAMAYSGYHLEVFYWARPSSATDPEVPAWAWPFVLWSALAEAYEADTLISDGDIAQMYRAMAEDVYREVAVKASSASPKAFVRSGGRGTSSMSRIRRRWPSTGVTDQ